jgi:hypothetical protein
MIPQTAMSLVILLLAVAQLVIPLQILVEFRQGLVRFREEPFVLGANGSLNAVAVELVAGSWPDEYPCRLFGLRGKK